jgi:hypothetical protein
MPPSPLNANVEVLNQSATGAQGLVENPVHSCPRGLQQYNAALGMSIIIFVYT